MYNYHIDLIWKINMILISVMLLLTVSIIIYSASQWYIASIKRRRLLKIKEKIYTIFAPGIDTKASPIESVKATPGEFLDIVTNRKIWATFFNMSEQEYFKHCFVSQDTIAGLERAAKRSLNKWRRIEAILALGYAGASSALGIFERGLFGKDRDISYFSMIALGQIKTDLSARILLAYLRKDRLSGQKIASIMETFPPSATDEVIKVTKDKEPSIRFWALKILSRLKPSTDRVDDILILSKDEDPAVRSAACECLGIISGSKVASALLNSIRDNSWLVRISAANALAGAIGPESSKYIVEMLKDNSLSVISAAKNILAKNIDSSRPYLEKILEGDDELAKRSAIEVLSLGGYTKIKHPEDSKGADVEP